MAQYIDKDAVMAEIEKLERDLYPNFYEYNYDAAKVELLEKIKNFIDTLEVKEGIKIGETEIYLNDDGGEPPYDGKQWLDLSCTEYEIPTDRFRDGDNVEIIIRKTQKGDINEQDINSLD